MTKLSLTGQKFNRLTVLSESDKLRPKRSAKYWTCQCDCGVVKDVRGPELKSGITKSCGCLVIDRMYKHGKDGTKIYNVWASMKARCQNPNHRAFGNYGGRGITVCSSWQVFENFFADMGEAPKGYDLDRTDNDKGYSPDNCKWVTRKENVNNQRTNLNLTLNGVTHSATVWAEKTGLSRTTIGRRLKAGWTDAKTLTEPLSRKPPVRRKT